MYRGASLRADASSPRSACRRCRGRIAPPAARWWFAARPAAARHNRRMTAAARESDQLDPAPSQPGADRVRIEARELAEAAHPPAGEGGLQVVAAIRFSEIEHVERQPVQEFALA